MSFSQELLTLQQRATQDIQNMSWPTRVDEEWRRSDPALFPFEKLEAPLANTAGEVTQDLQVYTNFNTAITTALQPYQGIHFIPWDDEQSNIAIPLLEEKYRISLDKVDVWRMTQYHGGGVIVIDDNTSIDTPINIVLNGNNSESIISPNVAILVGKNASVSIDLALQGDAFFSLGMYVSVDTQGTFHLNQLQNISLDSWCINTLFADCADKGNLTITSGQLGGLMAVDRVHTTLRGQDANVHLNGYYYAIEDQLIDLRTYQQHSAPHAESRSLYHGVATDESHTVYRGIIGVGDEAIETDAYLTNNNLLMSEEARMDSIPCLNIKTNDVRCSHGSTTGTLDPEHIFYLQSRGLKETDAKELLIDGFFQVIYDEKFSASNEIAQSIIKDRIKQVL